MSRGARLAASSSASLAKLDARSICSTGLRRIGIDEISHRKGQRYLSVVVDHDTGRLVWAGAGRDRKTIEAFFDELGEERCKQITLHFAVLRHGRLDQRPGR